MPTDFEKPLAFSAPKEETERELPIEWVAKELGYPYWTSVPASATGAGFEGPGWLLAGLMAGNKLSPEHPITKSKLKKLGDEASKHSIGHSAHPKKEG